MEEVWFESGLVENLDRAKNEDIAEGRSGTDKGYGTIEAQQAGQSLLQENEG